MSEYGEEEAEGGAVRCGSRAMSGRGEAVDDGAEREGAILRGERRGTAPLV